VTNPSFYPGGGSSITNPINTFLQSNFGYQIGSGNVSNVQNAVTAAIGRFTQYASNFTFLRDGSLTAAERRASANSEPKNLISTRRTSGNCVPI
jgi:hypothetical protein